MYAFNSAAIFLPGHPYIESTTVLSDTATSIAAPPSDVVDGDENVIHEHSALGAAVGAKLGDER